MQVALWIHRQVITSCVLYVVFCPADVEVTPTPPALFVTSTFNLVMCNEVVTHFL